MDPKIINTSNNPEENGTTAGIKQNPHDDITLYIVRKSQLYRNYDFYSC